MFNPVRQQDKRGFEYAVVTDGLGEGRLSQIDSGSLAFGQQAGVSVSVENNQIGPLSCVSEDDGILLRHGSRQSAACFDQKTDQVLSDPLLGGEDKPFFADVVPDLENRVTVSDSERVRRKI